MPIFSIEIDTDRLTCIKKVNGVEVNFDSISLSKYSYKDHSCCCEESPDPTIITSYDVSYEVRGLDGDSTVRESFYWDTESGQIERTSFTRIVSTAAAKLLKKLNIKK